MKQDYKNQNWLIYICEDCGCEYYFKFRLSNKCMTCEKIFHDEMEEMLKPHNDKILHDTLNFKENWLKKHNKK